MPPWRAALLWLLLGSASLRGAVAQSASPSAPIFSTVCVSSASGNTVTPICPAGAIITSVLFQSYGNPTGSCPSGPFARGSCPGAAGNSAIVNASCMGKNSCSVQASNDLTRSTGSCGSFNNFILVVRCQAVTLTTACVSSTTGNTVVASCPTNAIISRVLFQSYGNAAGWCPGPFSLGSCPGAAGNGAIVNSTCLGRNSCSIRANQVLAQSGGGGCGSFTTFHLNVQCTFVTPSPSASKRPSPSFSRSRPGSPSRSASRASSPSMFSTVCVSSASGNTVTPTCPAGAVITSVLFQSYGNPTGSCPSGPFARGSCPGAAGNGAIVNSTCLGRNSCSIRASSVLTQSGGGGCGGATTFILYAQCAIAAPTRSPSVTRAGAAASRSASPSRSRSGGVASRSVSASISPSPTMTLTSLACLARSIIITNPLGTQAMNLNEVLAVNTVGVNVARNQTCRSFSSNPGLECRFTIDGQLNNTVTTTGFYRSAGTSAQEFLRIDLGASTVLSHVAVANRNDGGFNTRAVGQVLNVLDASNRTLASFTLTAAMWQLFPLQSLVCGGTATRSPSVSRSASASRSVSRSRGAAASPSRSASRASSPSLFSTACFYQTNRFQPAVVTCPVGAVVSSVLFQSYGNPTGSCPSGPFALGSCPGAAGNGATVNASCLGRNSCSITPNSVLTTTGGCGSSTNFLLYVQCTRVTPTATPSRSASRSPSKTTGFFPTATSSPSLVSTVCVSAPTGNTVVAVCPVNGIITRVLFQSYGNPTGSCPSGPFALGSCPGAAGNGAVVNATCLGQNSCSIRANSVLTQSGGAGCGGATTFILYAQCTLVTPSRSPSASPTTGLSVSPSRSASASRVSRSVSSSRSPSNTAGFFPTRSRSVSVSRSVARSPSLVSTVCVSTPTGSSVVATCPVNGIITRVLFQSYGNPTGSCPSGPFAAGSCPGAAGNGAIVNATCLGQNSCSISPNGVLTQSGGGGCAFSRAFTLYVECLVVSSSWSPSVSPTTGLSVTPSRSVSASRASPSVSASRVVVVPSPSKTAAASLSRSASASRPASASPSVSFGASTSASPSVSPSPTQSPVSPSSTASDSPSVSPEPTPSTSPSDTASSSASESLSPSRSVSPSVAASRSPSASTAATVSPSPVTASPTITPTLTRQVAPSQPSATRTASASVGAAAGAAAAGAIVSLTFVVTSAGINRGAVLASASLPLARAGVACLAGTAVAAVSVAATSDLLNDPATTAPVSAGSAGNSGTPTAAMPACGTSVSRQSTVNGVFLTPPTGMVALTFAVNVVAGGVAPAPTPSAAAALRRQLYDSDDDGNGPVGLALKAVMAVLGGGSAAAPAPLAVALALALGNLGAALGPTRTGASAGESGAYNFSAIAEVASSAGLPPPTAAVLANLGTWLARLPGGAAAPPAISQLSSLTVQIVGGSTFAINSNAAGTIGTEIAAAAPSPASTPAAGAAAAASGGGTGAAVGGAIFGILVIAAIAVAAVVIVRKRRRERDAFSNPALSSARIVQPNSSPGERPALASSGSNPMLFPPARPAGGGAKAVVSNRAILVDSFGAGAGAGAGAAAPRQPTLSMRLPEGPLALRLESAPLMLTADDASPAASKAKAALDARRGGPDAAPGASSARKIFDPAPADDSKRVRGGDGAARSSSRGGSRSRGRDDDERDSRHRRSGGRDSGRSDSRSRSRSHRRGSGSGSGSGSDDEEAARGRRAGGSSSGGGGGARELPPLRSNSGSSSGSGSDSGSADRGRRSKAANAGKGSPGKGGKGASAAASSSTPAKKAAVNEAAAGKAAAEKKAAGGAAAAAEPPAAAKPKRSGSKEPGTKKADGRAAPDEPAGEETPKKKKKAPAA